MVRDRCLVIGGGGFLGSHVVEALLQQGYGVRVLDRIEPARFHANHCHPDLEYIHGDFGSEADRQAALEGCGSCFHLVSTTLPKTSNDNPIFDIESNLVTTVQLLGEASRAGIRRIVFLSSGGTVYGIPRYLPIDELHPTDPTNSYGIVKLAIEKYLALAQVSTGLDYVVLRLSNPFGEGQPITGTQGVIAVFMGKILRGDPIEIWGDGSVVRDYIYIRDVVEAMLLSLTYEGPHRIFNIGSGVPMRLSEVVDAIESVIGRPVARKFFEGRTFDVPTSVLSIERARTSLGWSPRTDFSDGLAKTRDWVRAQLGA